MQALSAVREQLALETSPAALFRRPPLIHFRAERSVCVCGGTLSVLKTRQKTVLSLAGPFVAHEKLLHCAECNAVYGAQALLAIVRTRCTVAYDVLVFVGRALFQRHRTTDEVLAELAVRNVHLSAAEIGYLGRAFILSLALAQRRAGPLLREAMKLAGGYMLHVDAMHAGDAPVLMTGLDSLSDIILANVKLPSENSEDIIPFLERIEEQFGTPAACVHDMGTGICKAVATVFGDLPDFICHFHFLRDIGKDFLDKAYDTLRRRLRKHRLSTSLCKLARELAHGLADAKPERVASAILAGSTAEHAELFPAGCAYVLVKWALNGKKIGHGYGFPFDRPNLSFAERLLQLHRTLPQFKDVFLRNDWRDNKPLYDLFRLLQAAAGDRQLLRAVQQLRWRAELFDQLRAAMRIAPVGGTDGLNSGDGPAQMPTIKCAVMRFRRKLDADPKLAGDTLCGKMATQIDKYGDKLFADPIAVDTPRGRILIQPQRTNNVMERLFRDLTRGHRRKTGTGAMGRRLQAMLADTPLVANLDNDKYMDILLGDKTTLEEVFAQIDAAELRKELSKQQDAGQILPGFTRLIRMPQLPQLVSRLFASTLQPGRSN